MVEVFREVRRVLRRDGTCWLNIGDSYNNRNVSRKSSHQGGLGFESEDLSKSWADLTAEGRTRLSLTENGMKEKDLCGIPWKLAFALQADGWYLRSDIIWAKPNPMPESVTDRPTKAHEYVFLLTREARYFWDADAIREPHVRLWDSSNGGNLSPDGEHKANGSYRERGGEYPEPNPAGRNARSVWTIATQPYAEAHFATFPEELPRRCIAAGTSERGCCPVCGAPWERRITATGPDGRTAEVVGGKAYDADGKPLMGDNMFDHGTRGSFNSGGATLTRETTGWRPTCDCEIAGDNTNGETTPQQHGAESPVLSPAVVLDPFMGSGTVALVARRLGRKSIGIELSPEYAELCARRLQQQSLFACVVDESAGLKDTVG
jgi:DNA modification methylase